MLRFTLAALCGLLLTALVGLTVDGKTGNQSAWAAPYKGPPLSLPPSLRLPLRQVAICRAGEKECRMASYITWCCRADQECDYSTVGGCSPLPGQ